MSTTSKLCMKDLFRGLGINSKREKFILSKKYRVTDARSLRKALRKDGERTERLLKDETAKEKMPGLSQMTRDKLRVVIDYYQNDPSDVKKINDVRFLHYFTREVVALVNMNVDSADALFDFNRRMAKLMNSNSADKSNKNNKYSYRFDFDGFDDVEIADAEISATRVSSKETDGKTKHSKRDGGDKEKVIRKRIYDAEIDDGGLEGLATMSDFVDGDEEPLEDGVKYIIDNDTSAWVEVGEYMRLKLTAVWEDDGSPYLVDGAKKHRVWSKFKIPRHIFHYFCSKVQKPYLYPYQKEGVQWALSLFLQGTGGILAFKMGLGKTRTTLATLGGLALAGTIKNALAIVPTSVLQNWKNEANMVLRAKGWLPNLEIAVVGSNTDRVSRIKMVRLARSKKSASKFYFVITTIDLAAKTPTLFKGFDALIQDEGHKLKNEATERFKGIKKIASKTKFRISLTGTPILNNPLELYTLLKLTTPGLLPKKAKEFNAQYGKAIIAARAKDATQYTIQQGARANQELQNRIKPYMLVKGTEGNLDKEIIPRVSFLVAVDPSEEQRKLCEAYSGSEAAKRVLSGDTKCRLEAFTHLTMISIHPLLVGRTESKSLADLLAETSLNDLLKRGPKLSVMLRLVEGFRSKGNSTIIFSQYTMVLTIIEKVLHAAGIKFLRLDGGTPGGKRQALVDKFNDHDEITVMLMSTKAGGVGLNVTGADRVIIFDADWTPANDEQAICRADRLGQTRRVIVYHLMTAGTVDERKYKKQITKNGIIGKVLSEVNVTRIFTKEEINEVFQLGPKGECKLMDTIRQLGRGKIGNRAQFNLLKTCPEVVDVIGYDDVYKELSGRKGSSFGGKGATITLDSIDEEAEEGDDAGEGGKDESGTNKRDASSALGENAENAVAAISEEDLSGSEEGFKKITLDSPGEAMIDSTPDPAESTSTGDDATSMDVEVAGPSPKKLKTSHGGSSRESIEGFSSMDTAQPGADEPATGALSSAAAAAAAAAAAPEVL